MWTEHVASKRPTPPPAQSAQPPVNEPAASGSTQQWAEYQARQAFRSRSGEQDDVRGRGGRSGSGDQTVLSGWWRRAGAFYIDTLLVIIVCLPLTYARYQGMSAEIDQIVSQLSSGTATAASPPELSNRLIADAAFVSMIQTVVYILAETFLVSRRGVTPGRLVTRIRVRRVGVDEPLDIASASRRTIVKSVSNLLGGVPVLSLLASCFQIVDYLWPLRDRGRQAVHDKAGTSEVVRIGKGVPLPRRRPDAAR